MSKRFRNSARGQDCTFRIPGVCNHDPETTVLCHAPHPDKGMGIKGPDTWAAFGCSACHDVMDSRVKFPGLYDHGEPLLLDLKKARLWLRAIRETQRRWIQTGLLPKD